MDQLKYELEALQDLYEALDDPYLYDYFDRKINENIDDEYHDYKILKLDASNLHSNISWEITMCKKELEGES